jgi:hypothetical protein
VLSGNVSQAPESTDLQAQILIDDPRLALGGTAETPGRIPDAGKVRLTQASGAGRRGPDAEQDVYGLPRR